MVMVTTCPACHTRFRVAPEQMASHGGDVRCGRCAKVFNAHAYLEHELVELQEAPPLEAPGDQAALPEGAAKDELNKPDASPLVQTPPHELQPAADQSPVVEMEEEGAQEFSTDGIEAFPLEETPVEEELAQPLQAVEELELLPEPPVAAEIPMPERGAEALAEPPAATELPVPEFIAPASVESVAVEPVVPETQLVPEQSVAPEPIAGIAEEPKKRSFFWLWLLGVLLLLVSLVVQGLYFYRTDLAANHPKIKPLLQQLCGVLECSIRLPANPDLLSIETSNLEADPQQASRVALNAILRNRAKLAQEYPQLELTLTDTQDKMIARRIFTPGEYAKGADLSRGMAPNEELMVKLSLDLGDLKAAGYRVLLFYP